MLKLEEKKYLKYRIYFYEEKYAKICKLILEGNYKILKEFKNTKRNYVALIEVDGLKFVYKEPRNEYRIIQRKLMTLVKKGEALNTLININLLIEQGIKEFVKPLAVVNSRHNGMIDFSFILMEYIDGRVDREYLPEMVSLLEKVHKLGHYHGDFNPGNIIVENGTNNLKIIDTQGKKMKFFNYQAHYDMITMWYDSWDEMPYPYNKGVVFYLAYLMKRFKRLKIVELLGYFRKKNRDKE